MASSITLTVRSYDNKNLTAYSGGFISNFISDYRDNLNLANSVTITEAGDTNSVMSAWALNGSFSEGEVLYWSVETATDLTATTRRVRIYNNALRSNIIAEGTAVIADGAAGTIYLSQVRESGVTGSVTLTCPTPLVDDTDAANTLTLTGVVTSNDLQLNGVTQFVYKDGKERVAKVTVDETVAEIQALIDGTSS